MEQEIEKQIIEPNLLATSTKLLSYEPHHSNVL